MKPCCASRFASGLAENDGLTAGGIAVLYGLMIASNKHGEAVISLDRLAERLKKSRSGVAKIITDLVGLGLVDRQPQPGRSTRYVVIHDPCKRCKAAILEERGRPVRRTGVSREKDTGVQREGHVSGTTSSITSERPSPTDPGGSSPSAETFRPIPDADVLSERDRNAWLQRIRGTLANAG